ncbi:MAG: beta-lactamase family protein [Gemmatimonadetes bacterium]|nr:beta-lactamase family protein [Gemmatimonadota bacterium]
MKPLALVLLATVVFPAAKTWGQAVNPWGGTRPNPAPYAEPIARARALLLTAMQRNGVPGAAVAVIQGGRFIWSEGLGYADVEQRARVTTRTKFRIHSVSKSLTSAALGLLVQEGKLDLDAPVQQYAANFPLKPYPVTTRQLAGHLGGVRSYVGTEYLNQRPFRTVAEGLAIFQDDSLWFRPGERYFYTTYGFTLISAVIEGVSGEPFLTFMHRRVFDPLRMRNTVADRADSLIPARAQWYTRDSAFAVVRAPYVDNSYKWAGAGFLSTAEDLALFGAAMFGRRLLHPRTVQLLWTSQRTSDGTMTGYGLGWFVAVDPGGRPVVGHDGGGSALLIVYPEQKFVFAFLSNSDQPNPVFEADIRELFLAADPLR